MSLLRRVLCIVVITCGFSSPVFASCDFCNPTFWTVDAAFGFGNYNKVFQKDAQTALGRLSLGGVLYNQGDVMLGLEAGVQTGNTMHLGFSKSDIDAIGGVAVEAQIKPLLDALITVRTDTLGEAGLFGILKGGMAYRHMQIREEAINEVETFAPEMQAGVGFTINKVANITLMYQYVGGKQPVLHVYPLTESARIFNIPAQQGVLLGLTLNFL